MSKALGLQGRVAATMARTLRGRPLTRHLREVGVMQGVIAPGTEPTDEVQAALELVGARPAAGARVLARGDRTGAGRTADRAVAELEQRVDRHLVLGDVRVDDVLGHPAGAGQPGHLLERHHGVAGVLVEDVVEVLSAQSAIRAAMGPGWERVSRGMVETEEGPMLLIDIVARSGIPVPWEAHVRLPGQPYFGGTGVPVDCSAPPLDGSPRAMPARRGAGRAPIGRW